MADSRPTERAMKAAVEMEIHATIGTRTVAKGETLDKWFPAYDDLLDACQKVINNWGDLHHKDLMQLRAAVAKSEARS